jgi:RimJ/RimL family protein N-acetyltransferase
MKAMSSLQIRELEPSDAAAAAALFPVHDVATAARVLHRAGERDSGAWIAEAGDAIVGVGFGRLRQAEGQIRVHGSARDELFARAERFLLARGAIRMTTYAPESELSFFELRAFTPGDRVLVQAAVPAPRERPDGVVSLLELEGREQELYELWKAVAADVPAEWAPRRSFPDWRARVLDEPGLSLDGSFVALDGNVPVAFTLLVADATRGAGLSAMTGTRPDRRGHGLATAVKEASVGWAAESGLAKLYTGNSERNEAMLAVNRALGYRRVETIVQLSR